MKKFKNPECPLCGDSLELNKKGHFHSKDGRGIVSVYFCEGCDQSYAMEDGVCKIAPFDSEMNPIKEECKTCGKIEKFRQKIVYILNDMLIYETYCIDCGVEFLRNWQRSRKGKVDAVTKDNVEQISDTYAFLKEQEIMSDPERLAKVYQSEPYKKIAEKLGKLGGKRE